MKKYIKPELFYEQYELSRNIADCAWELNAVEGECGFVGDANTYWQGVVIITDDVAGCGGKNADQEMYCYMVMADGQATFVS